MLTTTTNNVDGHTITSYNGIVSAEAILGANLFKDLFAGVRNIVGGRSAAYEKELRKAQKLALDELEQNAADLGSNAVVGIDLDYETIADGMLMVTASGTAVTIVPAG